MVNALIFLITNLFFTAWVAIYLLDIYFRKRYLFIKPSIQICFIFHFLFQWSLLIRGNWFYLYLHNPYVIVFLIHGFVLIGLLISSKLWVRTSLALYEKIPETTKPYPQQSIFIFTTFVFIIAILIYYFSCVDFTQTGLYGILFDPQNSQYLREYSLKLLPNSSLRYLFSFLLNVLFPLITILIACQLLCLKQFKKFRWMKVAFFISVLCFVLLASCITGARYFPTTLLIAIFLSKLVWNQFKFNSIYIALFLCILVPAVLISMMRTYTHIDFISFINFSFNDFFKNRILKDILKTGLQYLQYSELTQTHFGWTAFPKIANLFGLTAVNAPNIIGAYYNPEKSQYANANASFLFTYTAYFGLKIFPVLILLLLSLDLTLYVYRIMPSSLLIPSIIFCSMSGFHFALSDFTVVLISHGYFLGILYCFFLFSIEKYIYTSE